MKLHAADEEKHSAANAPSTGLDASALNVSAAGTRPEGTHDEAEAAHRVQEMFTRIAPRYDFLNHLLSLSFDRPWRARTARRFAHILARPDARVLDLCCGTGDLTFALERAAIRAAKGQKSARIFRQRFRPTHARVSAKESSPCKAERHIPGRRRALASVRRPILRPGDSRVRLPQPGQLRPRPSRNFPRPPPRRGTRHPRILRTPRQVYRPSLPLLLRKNSPPHRQHNFRQLQRLFLPPRFRSQIPHPRGIIRLDDPRGLHLGRFHSLDVQRRSSTHRTKIRRWMKQGLMLRPDRPR